MTDDEIEIEDVEVQPTGWSPIPKMVSRSGMSLYARAVYNELLNHGEEGVRPSVARLASIIEISESSVRKGIAELQDVGWIKLVNPYDPTTHLRQSTNKWFVYRELPRDARTKWATSRADVLADRQRRAEEDLAEAVDNGLSESRLRALRVVLREAKKRVGDHERVHGDYVESREAVSHTDGQGGCFSHSPRAVSHTALGLSPDAGLEQDLLNEPFLNERGDQVTQVSLSESVDKQHARVPTEAINDAYANGRSVTDLAEQAIADAKAPGPVDALATDLCRELAEAIGVNRVTLEPEEKTIRWLTPMRQLLNGTRSRDARSPNFIRHCIGFLADDLAGGHRANWVSRGIVDPAELLRELNQPRSKFATKVQGWALTAAAAAATTTPTGMTPDEAANAVIDAWNQAGAANSSDGTARWAATRETLAARDPRLRDLAERVGHRPLTGDRVGALIAYKQAWRQTETVAA